ncbi:glycosyl hydrolase BNR repeat-containing protein [Chloroherpeton thalassium ATCC 35110]|uniref:Glycosyl hydrolase BNR repeat-containing protein n=1 Tax=Chloroherpeton thalassium (strain ATCC 35110 / GB-78) TaxID=517418 RepID=B3QYH3_CHLT3|nr:sialidase family protein [Chloroherpeton thalassium]ACF13601.1 glycosyl hydrolase BNR repeat-containing protein [Chloroherpeton thalassium ATCC 35110]
MTRFRITFFIIMLAIFFAENASAQVKKTPIDLRKYALTKSESSNPTSNSASQICHDSLAGKVWLGTNDGLNVSSNGGQSFSDITIFQRFNENGIYGLDAKNDTIWASTAYVSDAENNPTTGDGMTASFDGGQTWRSFAQPLDAEDDTTVQYGNRMISALPVTVSEQNVIYDMAIGPAQGMVWAATWSGGIRRTQDNGQTWQRVVLPPTGWQTISPDDDCDFSLAPAVGSSGHLVFLGFSAHVAGDGSVWVGTVDGICRSNDAVSDAPSWTKYNDSYGGLSGNWVTAIESQPTEDSQLGTIWAATWPAEGSSEFYAASYTKDGGLSWKTALDGEKLYDFAFSGDTVYAVGPNGLFISPDNGDSWMFKRNLVDAEDSQKSVVSTASFYAVETEPIAGGGTRLWVGTGDGTAISEDGGKTWRLLRAEPEVESVEKPFAYPNPFSPKIDGVVRLRYKLSKSGSVTIRIFDFSMKPVCTVLSGGFRNAQQEYEETWNGKTSFGARVANGVYFYRIEQSGEEARWGKILVLE